MVNLVYKRKAENHKKEGGLENKGITYTILSVSRVGLNSKVLKNEGNQKPVGLDFKQIWYH